MDSADEYFEHYDYSTYFSFTPKQDIGLLLTRIAYFATSTKKDNNVTIEFLHCEKCELKLSVVVHDCTNFTAILSSHEPLDSATEDFFKNYLQSDFADISRFIMSSSK
jgi:hypothetical protein